MNYWQITDYMNSRGEKLALCRRHAVVLGNQLSAICPTEADCGMCELYDAAAEGFLMLSPNMDYSASERESVRQDLGTALSRWEALF